MSMASLINTDLLWKVKLLKLSNLRKKSRDKVRITKKFWIRLNRMLKMKKKILKAKMNKTKSKLVRCHSDQKLSCSLLKISFMIWAKIQISCKDKLRIKKFSFV